MSGQYGVENLKKVVALGVELGNVADKVGRSKGMARFAHALDLADEVFALSSVDFQVLKKEAGELDEADRASLKLYIKEKFDLVDDKLELAIEEALSIVEMQAAVVTKSVALYKSLKA